MNKRKIIAVKNVGMLIICCALLSCACAKKDKIENDISVSTTEYIENSTQTESEEVLSSKDAAWKSFCESVEMIDYKDYEDLLDEKGFAEVESGLFANYKNCFDTSVFYLHGNEFEGSYKDKFNYTKVGYNADGSVGEICTHIGSAKAICQEEVRLGGFYRFLYENGIDSVGDLIKYLEMPFYEEYEADEFSQDGYLIYEDTYYGTVKIFTNYGDCIRIDFANDSKCPYHSIIISGDRESYYLKSRVDTDGSIYVYDEPVLIENKDWSLVISAVPKSVDIDEYFTPAKQEDYAVEQAWTDLLSDQIYGDIRISSYPDRDALAKVLEEQEHVTVDNYDGGYISVSAGTKQDTIQIMPSLRVTIPGTDIENYYLFTNGSGFCTRIGGVNDYFSREIFEYYGGAGHFFEKAHPYSAENYLRALGIWNQEIENYFKKVELPAWDLYRLDDGGTPYTAEVDSYIGPVKIEIVRSISYDAYEKELFSLNGEKNAEDCFGTQEDYLVKIYIPEEADCQYSCIEFNSNQLYYSADGTPHLGYASVDRYFK